MMQKSFISMSCSFAHTCCSSSTWNCYDVVLQVSYYVDRKRCKVNTRSLYGIEFEDNNNAIMLCIPQRSTLLPFPSSLNRSSTYVHPSTGSKQNIWTVQLTDLEALMTDSDVDFSHKIYLHSD